MSDTNRPLQILLLEDSHIDAELAGVYLHKGGVAHVFDRVASREEFVGALDGARYDVILADYMLPAFDGMSALEIAAKRVPETPFIFLSGTLGEEAAIEALKNGATDYVVKQRMKRLPTVVLRSVEEVRLRTARRRAEETLRELNATLEQRVDERTRELSEANARLKAEAAEREKAEQAQRQMEEQLRQAQKMEAIGHLTGGVAHDFNNLLTVVLGNLETLQRHMDGAAPPRVATAIENAMRGAQRAASLTRSLLAFSRQQPLEPKRLDVNRLMADMSSILERTLGEQVAVTAVLADDLWPTLADPNQLESAVLNLAVNARDAMPDGGALTIETGNTVLDETYCNENLDAVPGDYIAISIRDNGIGMDEAVVEQAFEPFFTTKGVGHGTGLGLSQVYGFVKQSGGHIRIASVVGEGTTVTLLLPRHAPAASEADDEPERPARRIAQAAQGETILVVEDDADVRGHSTSIVRELGYTVLEAADGPSALAVLASHPEIRLLFTDIGLPNGMNGRELAEEATRRRPDLKVLFATAYARNAIIHDGRVDPAVHLITKPFTFEGLGERLRTVLGRTEGPARILVVEDEVLVRMLAVDELEASGYLVEEAGSAAEALERMQAAEAPFGAVIVDVGLPDRRGDALAADMRALRADLPIIVASGYDEGQLRARFGDDGFVAFIGKPYDHGRLVATLVAFGVVAQ